LTPIANLTTFFTASTSRGILSKHSAEQYNGVFHVADGDAEADGEADGEGDGEGEGEGEREGEARKTEGGGVANILAVYGTGDVFAFSTGRYRRFFDNVKQHWGNKVRVVEIVDGGHFWLDDRGRKCLLEEVRAFIA
jgi:hypothetical protein